MLGGQSDVELAAKLRDVYATSQELATLLVLIE